MSEDLARAKLESEAVMLTPLDITGLIRADLLRARSMAAALARNLGHVLDNADRALPFALTGLDDLLADDVLRLLGCLKGASDLQARLGKHQITDMALALDAASQPLPTAPNFKALFAQAAA